MMTEEQIRKALRTVPEPDLGKDIESLGMVSDVRIDGRKLRFRLTLTTPACPLKGQLRAACVAAIREQVDPEAEVEVEFDAKTSSFRTDKSSVLPGVKNIIAVVSGKGGVGKSTVAANLAVTFSRQGARTGLLDADIYGPSVPIMFGARGERPKMMAGEGGKGKILPLEKHGVRLMSIGLLVDDKNAVVWRGPMASSAIRQFVTDVHWGELDYLVIDMPPGTGDIHLTLVQTVPVSGIIVVTTPQDVALADARKAIAMFGQAQIRVPIIGIVENMSYFLLPGSSGAESDRQYIFGREGGRRLAEEYEIPFLGQIPLAQAIREGGDAGRPVAISEDPASRAAFEQFAGAAARSIAMLNARIGDEQRAEIVEQGSLAS